MPLISIILPCYNEESILEINLSSIIKYMEGNGQTYEIIIIDDGSKDKTGHIADRFSKKNTQIFM